MAGKRLKMSTSREVRRTVNRVANMLLNNEVDPKTANALLYACNVCLGAIRVDEQQQKLEELEQLIKEIEGAMRLVSNLIERARQLDAKLRNAPPLDPMSTSILELEAQLAAMDETELAAFSADTKMPVDWLRGIAAHGLAGPMG